MRVRKSLFKKILISILLVWLLLNFYKHLFHQCGRFYLDLSFISPPSDEEKFLRHKTDPFIHPSNINFALKPFQICKNSKIDLIGYIFSQTESFDQRQTIRETWANGKLFPTFKIIFILGESKNQMINYKIKEENMIHGDIIQGKFMDTLYNLTFKSMYAWKWIKDNCMNAKFVLKIDDDNMPNTFKLFRYLDYINLKMPYLKHSYFCEVLKWVPVDRSYTGKYSMTCQDYNQKYYSPYCCGIANIITIDMIPKLFNSSFFVPSFWVDDMYVGFVTNMLKVKMIDIAESIFYFPHDFKYKTKKILKHFLIARDVYTPKDIRFMWNIIMNQEFLNYTNHFVI